MKTVGQLPFEVLSIESTAITDAGIAQLEPLAKLHRLNANHTPITDAALATIAELPAVRVLEVAGTPVTDAGLVHLQKMKPEQLFELSTAHKSRRRLPKNFARPRESTISFASP